MRRSETISFRLTAAFVVLLGILIGFGLVMLMRVDAFNRESSAIRERWLKSTRYLGDLNNYTSDFRALEATSLIAPTAEIGRLGEEAKGLDDAIAQAQRAYEGVPADRSALQFYGEFQNEWRAYRREAQRVFDAVTGQKSAPATSIYFDSSRRSFSAASELLERLNDLNNANAQIASERAAQAIGAAWNYLSAAVILSAFTVVAILLYVLRIVIHPLKELSNCMELLAQGEMNVSIPRISQRNELQEMARAVSVFRSNAVDLKLSQHGLASQAMMLEEKLAHEIRLNEQHRNFISMASHEFRTPMTIIDGHAQRLLNAQEPASSAKILERARKIRTAVKRMSVILDNILKAAKFIDEEASLYLHMSEFDVRPILHEVCELHREISPNFTISENLGREALTLAGDRDLLFQAVNNIVANAVKYSRPGGAVRVDCCKHNDKVSVSVADEGIGIPERDAALIFERYYRADNAKSVSGTGIGLFFVKIVVDLHDGEVTVESKEGAGSKFTITLPERPLALRQS